VTVPSISSYPQALWRRALPVRESPIMSPQREHSGANNELRVW
jgi:hypothetical protein